MKASANLIKVIIGLLSVMSLIHFGYAADAGDCGLGLGQKELPQDVKEKFEELEIPQLFFTDKNIEAIQKSLDTYCCRTNKMGESDCAPDKRTLYPDEKPSFSFSPYYFDHAIGLKIMYLRGDQEICDDYDMDCFTRIDEDKGYPGKPVCFRFGEDSDPRCKSMYDVGSGVDVLFSSTDISSPSDYRSLYEKFRVDTSNLVIPSVEEAKDLDPIDLSMNHMSYYMCHELNQIYQHVLRIDTQSDQSMNPIPGSTFQKCQTVALMLYQSHGVDYIHTMSLAKGVDQLATINTINREHIMDAMEDTLQRLSDIRTLFTNVLNRFDSYTNTCSV